VQPHHGFCRCLNRGRCARQVVEVRQIGRARFLVVGAGADQPTKRSEKCKSTAYPISHLHNVSFPSEHFHAHHHRLDRPRTVCWHAPPNRSRGLSPTNVTTVRLKKSAHCPNIFSARTYGRARSGSRMKSTTGYCNAHGTSSRTTAFRLDFARPGCTLARPCSNCVTEVGHQP